ncbi:unnamed protein product (macronuclear) [Paramecium tetraurelia]|uniref:MSP domain-containing protein n=1 Tax=Paramecium tetraurelia TaxID=5888 RepID=A0DHW9_PARTE|nr:uncharacterized protein GSPATT00017007001 [Paramecium tetraurelia]CAK82636.1 unnamed protein product [Paramecium tetraurelia]|eukprot:XP_001450033.1 hypothetical protein (macronuclear) [Paramecium tetraurelia strain d4-2]
MSFIKLIGIDNQEIEFEENKNSVKEIKLQCIAKQERRITIKVKTTDPDVFQVVGKPIVFTELNQKGVLLIKANSAKKRDNDKDKICIVAQEYEDSLRQSAQGPSELKPPNIQEIILTVRVLNNKTTQQANDQKFLESKSLLDRQMDQIVESKFINPISKFGDTQKFQSAYAQFDNVIERQKTEFLSMYQQKSQINNSNIMIEAQPQYKQEYEQYLILTDEQEKELFKLSELKNKLQRQKLKQQQIVETPKPKALNTLHIGYAIIVVILSFMIGMLAKT